MKEIFNERRKVGEQASIRVLPHYQRRGGDGSKYEDYDYSIDRWADAVSAVVVAHYDAKQRVLVVDFETSSTFRLDIQSKRVLETHWNKSAAIRRAVELADAWGAEVAALLRPVPDDETILAQHAAAVREGRTPAHVTACWPFDGSAVEEEIPF